MSRIEDLHLNKNEFREIAIEMLVTDSVKYKGASLLEEILIDTVGVEKARLMSCVANNGQSAPTAINAA